MKAFDYAVIVPVYNSANTLGSLFERSKEVFGKLGKSFQMIFVDDESLDNSWDQILAVKHKHPHLVLAIRLAENCGQQKATLCGINNSNARFVVTIDDDLQIPPEEIEKLIAKHEETKTDMVYGLFNGKKHSLVRNIGSWFFNRFFGAIANTSGKGSSFRLIRGEITDKLVNINQKYLLLDEVLNWYTHSVSYVKVEHEEREAGKSGYSVFKLILIAFSYVIYYTIIPLRLMTYIGFFFSLITFIFAVFYIYNRLVNEVSLGFTSIIVAIFFSTSIILFSLGIIGEYISRIYIKETSKPSYVIKEMH